MSTVSQALSSELGSAQCGSSPVWNRQAPSSSVAAARNVGGSGRPPIARSAITTANVSSVAMTMPMISFRWVASIEVAVDDIDSSLIQRPHRQLCDASNMSLQTPSAALSAMPAISGSCPPPSAERALLLAIAGTGYDKSRLQGHDPPGYEAAVLATWSDSFV